MGDTLKNVEPEDLVKYGLIPEFIGRLPVIATIDDLDEEALTHILTDPKNALTKQYQKLFEMEGVKLQFLPAALKSISRKAIKRKTGARGLRTILEELLLDLMYEIPGSKDVVSVCIDEQAVLGKSAPKIVYKKKEPTTKKAEVHA